MILSNRLESLNKIKAFNKWLKKYKANKYKGERR